MNTTTAERLRKARSEHDVVRIVRDYVGEWSPEDLGVLPPSCRPGKMHDGGDICAFAYALARARFAVDNEEVEGRLVQLEAFFAQACARVAQISALADADNGEPLKR